MTDLEVVVTAIAQARRWQVTLDSAVVDALVSRREGFATAVVAYPDAFGGGVRA
jgi:hypothetical protein